MSSAKKNDWIAINLNAPENMSIDMLSAYGITPDNTGLQSEDYYKSQKQVLNSDLFKDGSGNFNEERFHTFYESALRSYNDYQKNDFSKKLLESIETSPYDVFALGNTNLWDTSAEVFRVKDPERTTHGLGNIYETGNPVWDIREVAQANKMRDKDGNILDYTPNDKGFLKGLFRPSAALAIYDDDVLDENGNVLHRKGDIMFDAKGDPFYKELAPGEEIYGRETLKFWDTITRDDSGWNKIDIFDTDGLNSSLWKTATRTALQLGLYFIPGVQQVMAYTGATIALSQTLPILSKSLDSLITGSTNNGFGKVMTNIENVADRFKASRSRDAMGSFLSWENVGNIIATSASQLMQQRMIGTVATKLFSGLGPQEASKLGRRIALGYMASTSSLEAYSTWKQAGADDVTAGIATLAYMTALFGLMNINYFRDWAFVGTVMDEDMAAKVTVKELIKENSLEQFKAYESIMKKPMNEFQRRLNRIGLYNKIKKDFVPKIKGWFENVNLSAEVQPTEHLLDEMAAAGKAIDWQTRFSMYANRAFNEGVEETMEEVALDAIKGITAALDAMGVKVTEDDKTLDFGWSGKDAMSRYLQSFLGGAVGGAVFQMYDHVTGGTYDSLLEKSLDERLVWYERNGYDKELRDRFDKLYRRKKLGNANLSATGKAIKDLNGENIVVYGEGDENDNQNKYVYDQVNAYLDRIKAAIARNDLIASDSQLFKGIFEKLQAKHADDPNSPETKLYHFLEDYDTAKVLTLQQLGFFSEVKKNASQLTYDILDLDQQIEAVKNEIRAKNHLKDTEKDKEAELFKNNQYLKYLENLLKEKRKTWDELRNGERNGYYMGLAHLGSSDNYIALYTDPAALVGEGETTNAQEEFSRTGIDNFAKYVYGINKFSDVTDEKLREKIKSEYDAFNGLDNRDPKKLRQIYDIHLKYARTFDPDIQDLSKQLGSKKFIPLSSHFLNVFKSFGDTTANPIIQQAAKNLEDTLKGLEKIPISLRPQMIMLGIENALNEAFPYIEGLNDTPQKLQFIKALTNSLQENNVYTDVKPIINSIMLRITGDLLERFKRSEEVDEKLPEANTVNIRLNNLLTDYQTKLSSDQEFLENFLDTLNDEEVSGIQDKIDNYKNARQQSYFDFGSSQEAMELAEALSNITTDRYHLLGDVSNARQRFKQELENLLTSIAIGSSYVEQDYKNLIKTVQTGTGLDENQAKKFIDDTIFVEDNLAEFIIEQQKIQNANNVNVVEALLSKFQIYSGENLFSAMSLLTDREQLLSRMKKPDEFRLTETEKRQLETALSFINVIAATLAGTVDGLNEEYNTSNSDEPLTVNDPNLSSIFEQQIMEMAYRINNLINLSNQNGLRTTRANQNTMLNMTKKRISALANIGSISFGEQTVDFKAIWEKQGVELDKTDITNAKSLDIARRNFESEVSEKLHFILQQYSANGQIPAFIDTLISKFGDGVYNQDPGELDDREETTVTPYGNVCYLLTLALINTGEFNSIFKTVIGEQEDLIPLYSQEYCVREAFAHCIDTFNGSNLFDTLHEKLIKYPKKDADGNDRVFQDSAYIDNRVCGKHFCNIDGIGGTGKTGGVDYLLYQCLKKKFPTISALAMGGTDTAAIGVHESLKLGKESKPALTFDEFLDKLRSVTDKNGKKSYKFDYDKLYKYDNDSVSENTPNFNKALSSITNDDINTIFNGSNERIIFFDESGLLDIQQAMFLFEVANKFNIMVIGSGDCLQNKASIKVNNKWRNLGIEDMSYHKLPSLMISMRSENSGHYSNVAILQQILREARKILYKDPSTYVGTISQNVGKLINKYSQDSNGIALYYDEKTLCGDRIINEDQSITILQQMVDLVKKLNEEDSELIAQDPKKKHKVAIVVDVQNEQNVEKIINRINTYKNKFKDDLDLIDIYDAKKVQGREYDYVLVDKDYDSTHDYIALSDFYTMVTRAKKGSAVVDRNNRLRGSRDNKTDRGLGFESHNKSDASQPIIGSNPEEKKKLYGEYTAWRMDLMEDIPEFVVKTAANPTATQEQAQQNGYNGNDANDGTPDTDTQQFEVQIAGVAELSDEEKAELESIKTNKEARDQYYLEQLLDPNSKLAQDHKTHHNNLVNRQELLKPRGKNSVASEFSDFDVFVKKLKDLQDDFFETHLLSIAINTNTTASNTKLNIRSGIALIARAILNNKNSEDRAAFITKAKDVLNIYFGEISDHEAIILKLQDSLQNDLGFFYCHDGYIYYTFSTDQRRVSIPISINTNESLNNHIFNNISFEFSIPAIPVSTGGEMMIPFNDTISILDGITIDEKGRHYIAIATYTKPLRDEVSAMGALVNEETRRAVEHLSSQNGKAQIGIITSSPSLDFGSDVYKITREGKNGQITSAVKYKYGKGYAQYMQQVGIQWITNVTDWMRATEILTKLSRGKSVDQVDIAWINSYFNESNLDKQFNASTSTGNKQTNEKNSAHNFEVLRNHKILNTDAIHGFTSALLRYIMTDSPEVLESFKERFNKNIIKWFGKGFSKDEDMYHRRGFGVTFKTWDGENQKRNIFYILPNGAYDKASNKNENTGFSVLFYDGINWVQIYTSGETLASKAKGLNFDFIGLTKNALVDASESSDAAFVKDTILSALSEFDDNLKSGAISIYPVDVFSTKEGDIPKGFYSAFEGNIYEWMVTGDDDQIIKSDINFAHLQNFLTNDTIFKNGMYRNIPGIHDTPTDSNSEQVNSTEEKGWIRMKDLGLSKMYTDITNIIHPLYTIISAERLSPEDEQSYLTELGNVFEQGTDMSSSDPQIDASSAEGIIDDSGIFIFYPGVEPIINSAWLKNYSQEKNLPNGLSFKIESINIINRQLGIIENKENGAKSVIIITDAGINSLLTSLPETISSKFKNLYISSSDGKYLLEPHGNKLIEHVENNIGDRDLGTWELIGVKDDIYIIKTRNGIVYVNLDKEQSKKLGINLQNILRRGEFVGTFTDYNTDYYIYNNNGNLIIYSSEVDVKESIPILNVSLDGTFIETSTGNFTITDKNTINNLVAFNQPISIPSFEGVVKYKVEKDFYLLFGNNIISYQTMRSYVDSNENLDEDDYVLLAVNNDLLGIYKKSEGYKSFKWVKKSQMFSNKILPDTVSGFRKMDLSKLDWRDPVSAINERLDNLNIEERNKFEDLESTQDMLTQYVFENNSFITTQVFDVDHSKDGVSVKARRNIYNFIKENLKYSDKTITDIQFENVGNHQIKAIWEIDGKLNEAVYVIDGQGRVSVPQVDAINTFDQIEGTFNKYLDALEEEFKNVVNRLSGLLSNEESIMQTEKRNILASKLEALRSISEAIKNNKFTERPNLSVLNEFERKLIRDYKKAYNDKRKC